MGACGRRPRRSGSCAAAAARPRAPSGSRAISSIPRSFTRSARITAAGSGSAPIAASRCVRGKLLRRADVNDGLLWNDTDQNGLLPDADVRCGSPRPRGQSLPRSRGLGRPAVASARRRGRERAIRRPAARRYRRGERRLAERHPVRGAADLAQPRSLHAHPVPAPPDRAERSVDDDACARYRPSVAATGALSPRSPRDRSGTCAHLAEHRAQVLGGARGCSTTRTTPAFAG